VSLRSNSSGEKGRVTKEDVQNFVKAALAQRARGRLADREMPEWIRPVSAQSKAGRCAHQETSSAAARNWVSSPCHPARRGDITDLKLSQATGTDMRAGIKITPLAFLLRAAVEALQQFPISTLRWRRAARI